MDWNKLLTYLAIIVPSLLILNFVVLSFYCVPSVDDYSYAHIVREMGFWKAQSHWYTTWTGRYAATLLISANPLLIDSVLAYNFISVFVFLISFFGLFYLIKSIFTKASLTETITYSLITGLLFLNYMPNIEEGFYWFPGSATYQISCAFMAILIGSLIRIQMDKYPIQKRQVIIAIISIVVICGLNEVAMLVTVSIIGLNFLYTSWIRRSIMNWSGMFVVVAMACGAIMYFAPGNEGRAGEFENIEKLSNIKFGIESSLVEAKYWIAEWSLFPLITIILLGVLLGRNNNSVGSKMPIIISLLVFMGIGFAFIVLSILPGFYATQNAPPLRTINVSFWLFIIFAIIIGSLVSGIIKYYLIACLRNLHFVFPSIALLTCLIVFFGSGIQRDASASILSGSAKEYREQYFTRDSSMASCDDSLCIIPAYSSFPFLIFHADISDDPRNWWNFMYAQHYDKVKVTINRSPLKPFFQRKYDFDSDNSSLHNFHGLDTAISESGSSSILISADDEFSFSFKLLFDTLETSYGNKPAYLNLSCDVFAQETNNNIHLVSVMQNLQTDKTVHWRSKTLESQNRNGEIWERFEFTVDLTEIIIKKHYELTIYIWNPNHQSSSIDNFEVEIY